MADGWRGVGLQVADGWRGVGFQMGNGWRGWGFKWLMGEEGRGFKYVENCTLAQTTLTYIIRIHTYRHTQPSSGIVVKLDLQLYQIDQKNFLLDFKCVNPSGEDLNRPTAEAPRHFTMEFFEICSRLISSLAQ